MKRPSLVGRAEILNPDLIIKSEFVSGDWIF